MLSTVLIILIVWTFVSFLAGGALAIANRLEHRRIYRCHVTGAHVTPRGVGTPQTVAGMRYAWWSCPACDREEHRRSDVGYDPTRPGVHLVCLDNVTPPVMWPRNNWRKTT